MGIVSLTLGITSLYAWLDPIVGVPISGFGMLFGAIALWRAREHRGKALAGLVTSFIGLLMGIIIFAGILIIEASNQGFKW